MSEYGGKNLVHVNCTFCENSFHVPKSMAGGMANCPECERAVEVKGGSDGLFRLLVAGGVLGIIMFSGLFFVIGEPLVGGGVFVIGAIIMGLVMLAL